MNPRTQSTSTEFWTGIEGRLAKGYPLRRLLGATDSHAAYTTEHGQDARPAVIKFIQEAGREPQAQITRWGAISKISHPNLISVLDHGQCDMDGVHLVYVVMEWAEDSLASVLSGRALTVSETKEMLAPILGLLDHLHERGLVHAAIQPSNILATGDQLKLSSDRITPVGEAHGGIVDGSYRPPESNGIASRAGDVWSLGLTLVQALTRHIPDPLAQDGGSAVESEFAASKNLPEPFSDIVRHCLRRDPDIRWTIPQVTSRLRGASSAPSNAGAPSAVPDPVEPLAVGRQGAPKSLYLLLGGIVAMIAIFAFLYGRNQANSRSADISRTASTQKTVEGPKRVEAVESHAQNARPAAPASETPAPIASAGTPRKVPGEKLEKSSLRAPAGNEWSVVAATYGKRKDADARVAAIKRRWPSLKPEVYPPTDAPLYFVILGASLSRETASSLQGKARAAGLPRDTYITNRLAVK